MNSGIGGIRMVGNEEKAEPKAEGKVVKEKTEQEKQRENSLAIFSQSEEAIQAADKMLRGFEIKLADDKTRPELTGPTGVVLGTAANRLFDSAVEDDPDKRAHYREVGLTSLAEVGVGFMKTLFAGNRRRVTEGKQTLRKK